MGYWEYYQRKESGWYEDSPQVELIDIDSALEEEISPELRHRLNRRRRIIWERVYDPSPLYQVRGCKRGRPSLTKREEQHRQNLQKHSDTVSWIDAEEEAYRRIWRDRIAPEARSFRNGKEL